MPVLTSVRTPTPLMTPESVEFCPRVSITAPPALIVTALEKVELDCSMRRVPPLKVTAPEPREEELPMKIVPPLMVVPPLYELEPVKVKVLAERLRMSRAPLPPMPPDRVEALSWVSSVAPPALIVMPREAVMPVVVCRVAPLKVSAPPASPRAASLLMLSVPALRIVPPV